MNELDALIALLARLPGYGPRSARRAALAMLQKRDSLMIPLARALEAAIDAIKPCQICNNLDATDPCVICADDRRDRSIICVVETVGDLWAIERARAHRGTYHVLGGTLSALSGRGPQDLAIETLIRRASDPATTEIILANSATVDGQTTAHYLAERLAPLDRSVTRLAHGVPVGGELGYLDDGTLSAALKARRPA